MSSAKNREMMAGLKSGESVSREMGEQDRHSVSRRSVNTACKRIARAGDIADVTLLLQTSLSGRTMAGRPHTLATGLYEPLDYAAVVSHMGSMPPVTGNVTGGGRRLFSLRDLFRPEFWLGAKMKPKGDGNREF